MRIDRFKLTMELMRQDMTQTQLAEKAGVSRVTVNGIKSGRSFTDLFCMLHKPAPCRT